jgi:hypothetical protein
LKQKKKKDHRKAKAIGSQVSIAIWNELKVQAIREGRKTGELLDDAIAVGPLAAGVKMPESHRGALGLFPGDDFGEVDPV